MPAVRKTRMAGLRMDKNEFLPCWPEKWFNDFIRQLKPEHLSVHPETGVLYDKLAGVLNISEKNIVITAGSDGAIRSAFEVFVRPGDGVVTISPTFAMYYIYAQIFGAKLVEVHFDGKLRLKSADILRSLNKKTRLVTIANPNSPTGTVIGEKDLLKITERASGLGAAVLIDEAYFPFYKNSMINFIDRFDNLIVTRTFSKAAGLAGMRVGFAASNKKVAKLLFSVKPMYEITTLSARLAEYTLDHYDRIFEYAAKTREGKEYLANFFINKGYGVFRGSANFLHVDFGKKRREIAKYLEKRNVLFKKDFKHPSLERFARFTVGPKESIAPFIEIFNKFNKRCKK